MIDTLSEAIGTISVVNYPYETDFLGPLPAWPVKAMCEAAINVNETKASNFEEGEVSIFDWTHILSLKAAAQLYYDPYGNLTCLNISASPITLGSPAHCDQSPGWDFMQCNQFPMPMGDDPAVSAFTWLNWDEAAFNKTCWEKYQIVP